MDETQALPAESSPSRGRGWLEDRDFITAHPDQCRYTMPRAPWECIGGAPS